MPGTSLAELLGRAAINDRDAFASFFDLTFRQARRLAQLVAAPVDVDQLMHDSYVSAWTNSASFHASGLTASAWLMTPIQRRASANSPGRLVS